MEGTFLVTDADGTTATLREVHEGQVVALESDPGLETGEVLEATVEAVPPVEVAYRIVEIHDRHIVEVSRSDESPTTLATELAAAQDVGEVTRRERAGEGEIHVLTVPPERTDAAVEDVIADEETLARAARLGVSRVTVRAANGVVSVRYLPS